MELFSKSYKKIKKVLNNFTINTKFIISYMAIIVLTLVFVGVFSYNIAVTFIQNQLSQYGLEVLRQINQNIDNSIDELDRISVVLSSDEQIQQILQKEKNRTTAEFIQDDTIMDNKINNIMNLRKDIKSLFIFSYNGEIYQYKGSDNSIEADYIFTTTKWFNDMKKLNKQVMLLPTYLPDEIIGLGQPKKVFSYIRNINDSETQEPIGCIMINMDIKIFDDILNNMNIGSQNEFVIVNNNKTIVYNTESSYISTQFRSPYISKLLELKSGNLVSTVDKERLIITFDTSSVTNWTIINTIPFNRIYSQITNIRYTFTLMILCSALIAFLVGVFISTSITRPINRLKDVMKKVEQGDFDQDITITSEDEIGQLSTSFNHMVANIKELIQKVYKVEILRKEAELSALQAQINPHFLYNTLQIMDLIAEEEGIDTISNVCRALAKIFRYSINRGKEVVPLSKELEHVKNYMEIQKIRFNNKIEMKYDIDESLYDYKMVKLILQPIVENAVFHGVENKRSHCKIIISACKQEEYLVLTVQDNGVGMNNEQLEKLKHSLNEEIVHAEISRYTERSIGIKNVNARIKLYFGEQYGIDIESQAEIGTKISIIVPAIPYL
ncbi:MAG: histidine kinase [Clostridia bacterium]|jgi:two-component system sensor histidine kinase YesM|nr:histidine kinase [Clostridia bacterium]